MAESGGEDDDSGSSRGGRGMGMRAKESADKRANA
jgi:hypothetical protein